MVKKSPQKNHTVEDVDYTKRRIPYYRFLKGTGLDVGPFDKPFVINPSEYGINVKYVDRYTAEELKKLFPEIKDLTPTTIDYICDVSREGFSFADDNSYDFVILSHILEHMANPFFIIKDAYRILKDNGVLYISVPDCRFSNDKGRPKTTYRELEYLFRNNIREISDDYVLSYLKSPVISKVPWVRDVLENPPDAKVMKEICDNERRRSFHVHVWDRVNFFQHIIFFLKKNTLSFSLLDLDVYENNSYENIIVLRKIANYELNRLELDIKNLYLLRSGENLPDLDIEKEVAEVAVQKKLYNQGKKRYKVAVITRTKNRPILLRRAIESVLGQTFQDWIMVIVNDGGIVQDVERLVERYKDKFKERCLVIHNETSLGMEAASNRGIRFSDSEYVVIHDDDDSWHPRFLEKCVNFLDTNQHKTFKGVITYSTRIIERIEGNNIITEHKEPFNTWMKSVSLFRMAANNIFPPISFVYKRDVLDEIGYYREDLPVLGDWEFNLRFMSKYDIYLIPEELAYYHHRLSIKSGELSNSVVGHDDKHIFYDTLIRNELLRKDLERNALGLGYLVNLGKSFEVIHGQIYPIERFISRLKNISWLKRIAKKFLWKKES